MLLFDIALESEAVLDVIEVVAAELVHGKVDGLGCLGELLSRDVLLSVEIGLVTVNFDKDGLLGGTVGVGDWLATA